MRKGHRGITSGYFQILIYLIIGLVGAVTMYSVVNYFTNPELYAVKVLDDATDKIARAALLVEVTGEAALPYTVYLPPPPGGTVYRIKTCEEAEKEANINAAISAANAIAFSSFVVYSSKPLLTRAWGKVQNFRGISNVYNAYTRAREALKSSRLARKMREWKNALQDLLKATDIAEKTGDVAMLADEISKKGSTIADMAQEGIGEIRNTAQNIKKVADKGIVRKALNYLKTQFYKLLRMIVFIGERVPKFFERAARVVKMTRKSIRVAGGIASRAAWFNTHYAVMAIASYYIQLPDVFWWSNPEDSSDVLELEGESLKEAVLDLLGFSYPLFIPLRPRVFGLFLMPSFSIDPGAFMDVGNNEEGGDILMNCVIETARLASCDFPLAEADADNSGYLTKEEYSDVCHFKSQEFGNTVYDLLMASCRGRKLFKLYADYSSNLQRFLSRLILREAKTEGMKFLGRRILLWDPTAIVPMYSAYAMVSPTLFSNMIRAVAFSYNEVYGEDETFKVLKYLSCAVSGGEYFFLPEILGGVEYSPSGKKFDARNFPSKKLGGRYPALDVAYALKEMEEVIGEKKNSESDENARATLEKIEEDIKLAREVLCLLSIHRNPWDTEACNDLNKEDILNAGGFNTGECDKALSEYVEQLKSNWLYAENYTRALEDLEEETKNAYECLIGNPRSFEYIYALFHDNYQNFIDKWLKKDFQGVLEDSLLCADEEWETKDICEEKEDYEELIKSVPVYCGSDDLSNSNCGFKLTETATGSELECESPPCSFPFVEREAGASPGWECAENILGKSEDELTSIANGISAPSEVTVDAWSIAGLVVSCTNDYCQFGVAARVSSDSLKDYLFDSIAPYSNGFEKPSKIGWFIPMGMVVYGERDVNEMLSYLLQNFGLIAANIAKILGLSSSLEKYFGFDTPWGSWYMGSSFTCPVTEKDKFVMLCITQKSIGFSGDLACKTVYIGSDEILIKPDPLKPTVTLTYYRCPEGSSDCTPGSIVAEFSGGFTT